MTTLERILAVFLVMMVVAYGVALDSSEKVRARQDIYIEQLEAEKEQLAKLVDILTPMESPIMGLIKPKQKCVKWKSNGKCRRWK